MTEQTQICPTCNGTARVQVAGLWTDCDCDGGLVPAVLGGWDTRDTVDALAVVVGVAIAVVLTLLLHHLR